VQAVSCSDRSRCVASVASEDGASSSGSFVVTRDGGENWTIGGPEPTTGVSTLRCDPDGRCVALADANAGMVAYSSTNSGATWTAGAQATSPRAVVAASCGDALHCVYAARGGGLTFTADGDASWVTAAPRELAGQIVTAIDCVDAMECWVAASRYGVAGYAEPTIYRTRDGGGSWAAFKIPGGGADWAPSSVAPLSCPTTAGCVGMARMTSSSSLQSKWVVVSNS
jgi:photosystem II stability/assembly factor-like uncharacterized protein